MCVGALHCMSFLRNVLFLFSLFQIVTIRLSYKLKWKETRMSVNESIDWSKGEINISPENIQVTTTRDTLGAEDTNVLDESLYYYIHEMLY